MKSSADVMREEFYYDSCGAGKIHACRWTPQGTPRAVVQIVHGIAEYALRYDAFARFLNSAGYLVVAEDHMGHGDSGGDGCAQGYFNGGWFGAVDDSYALLKRTKAELPNAPYVLLGHSMGSFMARTILARRPDSGIDAAIICGTGWQPKALLSVGIALCNHVCKTDGEKNPSKKLEGVVFGSYNRRVEHPRTPFDWLSRDERVVDAYLADPKCGFVATAGLLRDMLTGIAYIEQSSSLEAMRKDLPVLFIAGGDDPVGAYGKGVRKSAQAFQKAGMRDVSCRIYPLCRHELLNEINQDEIYGDIAKWLAERIK